MLHLEGVAVGAFGLGGVDLVRADLDLIQRAVVLGIAVILAFLDGAFDGGVCIAAAGRIFHEKSVLSRFIASSGKDSICKIKRFMQK